MTTLDPSHAETIRQAIAQVNAAMSAGLSPTVDALAVLDAVAALQADLRGILEAERRRTLLAVV